MSGNLNKTVVWLTGLAVGLVLGLIAHRMLPQVQVHATATEGFDNFAIATGLADGSVEGVYFLDYLTGELKCAVINPKTGKFTASFTYNVAADFRQAGAGAGNAKYLLVTGLADMPVPRGAGNFQYGKSIVYIAEATSGLVAAYTIQWNPALLASGRPQQGAFQLLDFMQFRTTAVRDP
jgi:hypothetical protein